ncbi:tyrosine-type recombinase/integrase [Planctomyces sp. SH-PL14]|uniref:tyrosine-type recombinase/integrase n=1 Tax=Planctomyces sp. SH-PL14 TaxID=1632864 RepID=UPI00078BF90B|nr:tyrosine-type recombinase/integrase [Planctomyces sp. SH-PL14]AMV17362.1 site-specific tyrosine recombinase XerC [Planctomyces sp. SH-PL14]
MSRKSRRSGAHRTRVGKVSLYQHHGAWWVYYRDDQSTPIRRRVGCDQAEAERVAAELNAQVTVSAPTLFSFEPVSVLTLRDRFIAYHETVLRSSLATVNRYRTALEHLVAFAADGAQEVHRVSINDFVAFLRTRQISPNGHPNTRKRTLRDKGLRYILEVCRSAYAYAQTKRHLPPYAPNPFAELPIDRLTVEDAKPVFVFDAKAELAFLRAAKEWEFPVHLILSKTGMRPGELCHLLIEEVELCSGWIHIRNKPDLGWSVKTRNERSIPIPWEVRAVLSRVIGDRGNGLVFRRPRFEDLPSDRRGSLKELRATFARRLEYSEALKKQPLTRQERARIAKALWAGIGILSPNQIRTSFIRISNGIGLEDATCPKSWRHSFATLLQDANVDPLLRQITLGHKPAGATGALGMTSIYSHSRPETQAREIERALRTWPETLTLAAQWAKDASR